MRMRSWILLSLLFFFVACEDKNKLPEGVMPKEKMQAVLWDFIEADAFSKKFVKKDTALKDTIVNIELQQQIFSLYKIDRSIFEKSYTYYSAHTDLMKAILDSMISKADKERNNIKRVARPENLH